MNGKHRKEPGQGDVPLYGSETVADGTDPNLAVSHQPMHSSGSVTDSAGYRGFLTAATPEYALGAEIWSMDLIKNIDSLWLTSDGYAPVGNILPAIIQKVMTWEEYEYLRNSMEVYGQQVPIRVIIAAGPIKARLRDGINRVALAEIMGWDSMLVTTGIMETSMWQQWDESEQGLKFHDAKAKRLGVI